MAIEFLCPGCGQKYRVSESLAGRKTRCKQCAAVVEVPQPQPAEPNGDLASFYDEELKAQPARPKAPDDIYSGTAFAEAPSSGHLTVASLPGQLDLDVKHYLKCYPAEPCSLLAAFLGLPLGILWALSEGQHNLAGYIAVAWIAMPVAAYGWLRTQRLKFQYGDLCPAVVLGDDPWRVAVFTDLSTGGNSDHPAIKILNQPLGRMGNGRPKVGDRLVAVATYVGLFKSTRLSLQQPCWANFTPDIINCGTRDAAAVRRAMNRIPEGLWQQLDYHLRSLDSQRPGLYRLWDKSASTRQVLVLAAGLGLIGVIIVGAMLKGRNAGNNPPAANEAKPLAQRQQPVQQPKPPAPAARVAAAPNPPPQVRQVPAAGADFPNADLSLDTPAPVPKPQTPAPVSKPPMPAPALDVAPQTAVLGGGGDQQVRDAAPPGGLLVGFEVGLGQMFGGNVVQAVRAIYRVGDEESFGQQFGTNLNNVVTAKAKPGYAVGAITVKAGLIADGFSVTFMRIDGDRLDPLDAYESEWLGGKGGAGPKRLGGDGRWILGIVAKQNRNQSTGLGLLYDPSLAAPGK